MERLDTNKVLKRIPGYLNYYANRLGEIYEWKSQQFHLLPQSIKPSGHHEVYLMAPSGYTSRKPVHRLICSTFNGVAKPNVICCHRNDIKADNSADNLYWGTHINNSDDLKENTSNDEWIEERSKLDELKDEKNNLINLVNSTSSTAIQARIKERRREHRLYRRKNKVQTPNAVIEANKRWADGILNPPPTRKQQ